MSKSSRMRFFRLSLEISVQLFFFPFLFDRYIVVLLILMIFVLFLVVVISLFFFLSSLRVVVSIHQRCLQCKRVLFLLFVRYIACLCHLWNVKSYASSLVCLLSGPFVEDLSSSSSRMVSSILKRRQPRHLSL